MGSHGLSAIPLTWKAAGLMSTHGDTKQIQLGLGAVDQGPAVEPLRPRSLSFGPE